MMDTYKVTISWNGCMEEYYVDADSREDAAGKALNEASYDFYVEEVEIDN